MAAYDECRSDWALATGRVLIAIALVASAWGEVSPDGRPWLPQVIALAYLSLGAAMVLVVRLADVTRVRRLAVWSHVGDVANAGACAIFTAAGAPVALAIGFSLIAAAYRWGFLATLVTASALAAVQLGQALVAPIAAGGPNLAFTAVAPAVLTARAGYVLVAGVLLGYLAATERHARLETATVAYVASRLDLRVGLTQSVAVVLDALIRVFDAARVIVAVQDVQTGRVTRWERRRVSGNEPPPRTERTVLDPGEADQYQLGKRCGSVHVVRSHGAFDARWLGPALPGPPAAIVAPLGDLHQVIGVGIEMPGDWRGRVFLIDPHVSRDRYATLKFAQQMVRRLAPAVHQVYLLRRLRGRSVAEERARLARELHDGVVQSILGVQVQLHALSVQARTVRPELAADLSRLGLTLREEVLKLREMMQQMKPVAPGPDELMNAIGALVQRFETETAIRTRLITSADEVPLQPAACLEVMRIVQEALVNVRRHSGASNVVIRFNVDGDTCRLWFDDDGRGFAWEGRLSLADMDKRVIGPAVMRDRVKRLGGQMTVESLPGRGSRIEIAFPVSTCALQ